MRSKTMLRAICALLILLTLIHLGGVLRGYFVSLSGDNTAYLAGERMGSGIVVAFDLILLVVTAATMLLIEWGRIWLRRLMFFFGVGSLCGAALTSFYAFFPPNTGEGPGFWAARVPGILVFCAICFFLGRWLAKEKGVALFAQDDALTE